MMFGCVQRNWQRCHGAATLCQCCVGLLVLQDLRVKFFTVTRGFVWLSKALLYCVCQMEAAKQLANSASRCPIEQGN